MRRKKDKKTKVAFIVGGMFFLVTTLMVVAVLLMQPSSKKEYQPMPPPGEGKEQQTVSEFGQKVRNFCASMANIQEALNGRDDRLYIIVGYSHGQGDKPSEDSIMSCWLTLRILKYLLIDEQIGLLVTEGMKPGNELVITSPQGGYKLTLFGRKTSFQDPWCQAKFLSDYDLFRSFKTKNPLESPMAMVKVMFPNKIILTGGELYLDNYGAVEPTVRFLESSYIYHQPYLGRQGDFFATDRFLADYSRQRIPAQYRQDLVPAFEAYLQNRLENFGQDSQNLRATTALNSITMAMERYHKKRAVYTCGARHLTDFKRCMADKNVIYILVKPCSWDELEKTNQGVEKLISQIRRALAEIKK